MNQSGLVANCDSGDHALFGHAHFSHFCESNTLVPFGVRSFSTTLNEMPSSHYGRRMMVSKLYLIPFSSYGQKTSSGIGSDDPKSKVSNFGSYISLFTIISVLMC